MAQLGQPYGTFAEPKESASLPLIPRPPVDSQAFRRFPGLRPGLTEPAFQAEIPVRSPFPVSFFDPERVVLPAQGATLGLLGPDTRVFSVSVFE